MLWTMYTKEKPFKDVEDGAIASATFEGNRPTLSVGDAFFREKARVALEQEFHEHRAVVLVSHAEQQVERLCDRAILLEQGGIAGDGHPGAVFAAFADLAAI